MPERDDRPDRSHTRRQQKRLGAALRSVFDEVVNEPVPDDFLKLLEEAERNRTARDGDNEK